MSIARNDRHPGRSIRPHSLEEYEKQRTIWLRANPEATNEQRVKAMRQILSSIPVHHIKVKREFV